LIAVPVIICATNFERIFYLAFETTGGFGDPIINGIFPVLMVWMGRYRLGYGKGWRVPGGKPLLIMTFIFFASVLLVETSMKLGLLNNPQAAYDAIELHDLNIESLSSS
jgi:tyrosine-specific transport protein